MAKNDPVINEKARTFSVNHYLKGTELSKPLQRMMKDLYHGQAKTMDEWKEIDKKTNKERCN
jgi:hypothetical protein